ncbi:MAG: AraC family transcriptional regulator [Verrucomicrobiae bacterium]|nr:AraC family transcriptional regulator [Verrucomicrobiae bacterium]
MENPIYRHPYMVVPGLICCDVFPMAADDFCCIYRSPKSVAFHLYLYSGRFRIGNQEYELKKGDATFTPFGVKTSYQLRESGRHWCAHFRFSPDGFEKKERIEFPLFLRLGDLMTETLERFQKISHLLNGPAAMSEKPRQLAEAGVAFQEMLLWLAREYPQREKRRATVNYRHEKVFESISLAVEHQLSGTITVPGLARHAGLSRNYLIRLFRKKFGMTLHDYVLARRITRARHLLEHGTQTVGEVGVAVGIGDPQYFNKCFRRVTGVSPSVWRQRRVIQTK